MKNRDNIPILTDLARVLPRNIHTKFEANRCIVLREETNVILHVVTYTIHCKYACYMTTKKLIRIIR